MESLKKTTFSGKIQWTKKSTFQLSSHQFQYFLNSSDLVGGWALTLWKMMDFVNWDDDIPNLWWKHHPNVPFSTNQIIIKFPFLLVYTLLTTINHGSLNVPIEHHPTIRYMVYNGYYKVMSNIPKMGHLPTPANITINITIFQSPTRDFPTHRGDPGWRRKPAGVEAHHAWRPPRRRPRSWPRGPGGWITLKSCVYIDKPL